MSKELEACFKEIYQEIEYVYADKVNSKANENWDNDIKHYDNIRSNVMIIQNRLESINNANPSEALECLKRLDITIRYSTIDDEGYSLKEPRKMINSFDEEFTTIEQALIKAQEQEKENARLKEILINGFTDKNGVFHKQTYLAFIDGEWCICDLKTDEWFLVKEVF